MIGPQCYGIPTGLIVLATGARIQVPLVVENFWDFIWLDGMFSTTNFVLNGGQDNNTFSGALINVLPSSGQEKVFKDLVPLIQAFSCPTSATMAPRRLPWFARFNAGTTFMLDVLNILGAPLTLRVTFVGARVEPGTPWPLPRVAAVAQP